MNAQTARLTPNLHLIFLVLVERGCLAYTFYVTMKLIRRKLALTTTVAMRETTLPTAPGNREMYQRALLLPPPHRHSIIRDQFAKLASQTTVDHHFHFVGLLNNHPPTHKTLSISAFVASWLIVASSVNPLDYRSVPPDHPATTVRYHFERNSLIEFI